MSLEADIRRDTNLTPTRFLLECGEFTPSMSLNFDQPFNPFEASYKLLNTGTPKAESDFFSDYKACPDSIMELTAPHPPPSQQQNLASGSHHPWSDMLSDEACMPLRQMSSPSPLSTYPTSSASYSSSSCTLPLSASSTRSSSSDYSRSRMQSMSSDYMSPTSYSTSYPHTHEYTLDTFAASATKYHSDQELPPLAPDSPTPDSLVPGDTLRPGFDMNKFDQNTLYDRMAFDDEYDQEMSDQHDSGMDVDSNESQDEDSMSSKGRSESRDPTRKDMAPAMRSTRSRAAAAAKRPKAQKTSKSARAKKSTGKTEKSSNGQRSRASSGRGSSSSTKTTTKCPRLNRKHSSSGDEEDSREMKRQKFLERNRMAASKCREKKRQQTLKTISDADEITARNHALHKSLDELQEEVRSLKNQILCHRDCGCDVIQKFVQTTMGSGSTKFPRQR